MFLHELENIYKEDKRNGYLEIKFIGGDIDKDSKWDISNCRYPGIGDRVFINAYEFSLKEAIDIFTETLNNK